MKGVYLITNTANGKIYVGSSLNVANRLRQHVGALRSQRHDNIHIQRAWNEYGESSFTMSVAEVVEDAKLIEAEQVWIDKLDATNRHIGYNIMPCAQGRPMPEEVKAKIREKHKGKVLSAEHRKKLSASHKGKTTWNKGRVFSPKAILAMSIAAKKRFQRDGGPWNKGIPMSDEIKAKVSASRKGKCLGNTNGFQRGHGFWTGKKRLNVSGENHHTRRVKAMNQFDLALT